MFNILVFLSLNITGGSFNINAYRVLKVTAKEGVDRISTLCHLARFLAN